MHLKRPIQKVGVQKAAAIYNAGLRYTYFKITKPMAGYVLDPAHARKIQYSVLTCGGGGLEREREKC
jgi:hypothetical protein